MLAGQLVIVGTVVSTTVITWVHMVTLLAQSVAVQVRVITCSFAHAPGATLSVNATTGAGSQLSLAVAGPPVAAGVTGVLHCTVTAGGQKVIMGAVVSTTLITWAQLTELPAQSVAVQVRVITIVFGQAPATTLSDEVIIGAGSQLSVAV